MKKRLIEFLAHLKIGQDRFEKNVGLSRGFVNNVGDSIRVVSMKKILAVYPELNQNWLLTGEGEMLKNSESLTTKLPPEDYMLVPLYNLDAKGGFSENEITDSSQYIVGRVPFPAARKGDKCVPVSGDSMIPVYPPGSIILIRKVEGWREYFGFGNNFVLTLTDGRRIIKRVQKSEEDPKNNVLCVSYNPNVDDEELPKSMIDQVFKVIRTLTEEGY